MRDALQDLEEYTSIKHCLNIVICKVLTKTQIKRIVHSSYKKNKKKIKRKRKKKKKEDSP